jgi:hypothetical protein
MSRFALFVGALGVLALASDVDRRAVRLERIGVAGASIELPPGWHAMPRSAQPRNDSVTRIIASSGPIWFGGGCNGLDYSSPPTAVAIVHVECVQQTACQRGSGAPPPPGGGGA